MAQLISACECFASRRYLFGTKRWLQREQRYPIAPHSMTRRLMPLGLTTRSNARFLFGKAPAILWPFIDCRLVPPQAGHFVAVSTIFWLGLILRSGALAA